MNPILEEHQLFLVDVTVSSKNEIAVYIDALTGTTISACITVSKALDANLNREEEDYELTVSTAGIGYPFKVPLQYEKNLGKEVEVKFADGKKLQGILKAYDEKGVTLLVEEKVAVEGKKKKELVTREKDIPFTEIKEVKDVVIF